MSVFRIVGLMCDGNDGTCDNDSPLALTEGEARRLARKDGWSVSRSRKGSDYCPDHR